MLPFFGGTTKAELVHECLDRWEIDTMAEATTGSLLKLMKIVIETLFRRVSERKV